MRVSSSDRLKLTYVCWSAGLHSARKSIYTYMSSMISMYDCRRVGTCKTRTRDKNAGASKRDIILDEDHSPQMEESNISFPIC